MLWNHPTVSALAAFLADKVAPTDRADDVPGPHSVADSELGVLDDLFDSVEAGLGAGVMQSWDDD
jgi:hypothetical protein